MAAIAPHETGHAVTQEQLRDLMNRLPDIIVAAIEKKDGLEPEGEATLRKEIKARPAFKGSFPSDILHFSSERFLADPYLWVLFFVEKKPTTDDIWTSDRGIGQLTRSFLDSMQAFARPLPSDVLTIQEGWISLFHLAQTFNPATPCVLLDITRGVVDRLFSKLATLRGRHFEDELGVPGAAKAYLRAVTSLDPAKMPLGAGGESAAKKMSFLNRAEERKRPRDEGEKACRMCNEMVQPMKFREHNKVCKGRKT